ncbi:MAG: citramalate synthase [Spirochaetes bacterium]|nr:citramalate synthase [Spirochaetota bacterium]
MNVKIYDTTLRDGMQGEKVSFTLEDKLRVAQKLDELGVHYVEGGFPLANAKEEEFFRRAAKMKWRHARLAAFGSTRRPGSDAGKDAHLRALLEAETPVVTMVGKAWIRHVTEVLRATAEENLAMIEDSARLLKKAGREVVFDAEHFFDGFKDDPAYALRALKAARDGGADILVLCDTNGGAITREFLRALEAVREEVQAPYGVHLHNDSGLAVAHSCLAVEHGALQIQGTLDGWGERCGNANLCSIIPNLQLKMGMPVLAVGQLRHLTNVSRFVCELANLPHDHRQPFTGVSAFAHKAGQHADVIIKNPALMEHLDGALVGNERRVLLSELAGKSTLVYKLRDFGDYDKGSREVDLLTRELKARESEGYEYETAEASFELLIRRCLGVYRPMFTLLHYEVESFQGGGKDGVKTFARVRLSINGVEHAGNAVGSGPVGALDCALRDAVRVVHPFIDGVKLTDFKVRILDGNLATNARTRVFVQVSDGAKTWETVGVSENIIEASWQALIDGYEYFYNRQAAPAKEAPRSVPSQERTARKKTGSRGKSGKGIPRRG